MRTEHTHELIQTPTAPMMVWDFCLVQRERFFASPALPVCCRMPDAVVCGVGCGNSSAVAKASVLYVLRGAECGGVGVKNIM